VTGAKTPKDQIPAYGHPRTNRNTGAAQHTTTMISAPVATQVNGVSSIDHQDPLSAQIRRELGRLLLEGHAGRDISDVLAGGRGGAFAEPYASALPEAR